MDTLLAFIPVDRQIALADSVPLPLHTRGSALFADLSGFTPLTEALVRALGPQRGAEELTRQLNLVYDALIGQVEKYHGTVIGFSGDAITCWFDGDDGTCAFAAAFAMQAEMKQFAAVPIPNGTAVSLALKAAIVTGQARRFAVGDPNIQLIDVLAGAVLDRLAETEHHAEKGEVVTDNETAESLGNRIRVTEWRQEQSERFAVIAGLTVPVEPNPWQRPPSDAIPQSDIRSWLLPPVYARLSSAQPSFLAELRPAVSLFLRFGGIDFESDPGAATKLDNYVHWVQSIINKYEGILVQLTIGDKGSYLYAAFGAPIAHDDDTARALRAARELQTPPPELHYITKPQIGVSRGRMRVGPYGGTTRRTYGVLGDEVNVAARLMQAAKPGQILVTERVANVTERIFDFDHLEPIRVKGKSEPLHLHQLRGELEQSARGIELAYTLPLVGRKQELTVLRRALSDVRDSRGQLVVLEGEAGVGKSRLAHEAIQYAVREGFEDYRAECPSYGTNSSFLVWHSILRAFFGIESGMTLEEQVEQLRVRLESINPGLLLRAPLLSAPLNLPIPENDLTLSLDGRVRKQLLEALIVECIRTESQETPLAFLLEDCHWMDALSNDLLEQIVRETADRPVFIVVTLRPPDLERLQTSRLARLPNATVLPLGDFSAEDAARLIELKYMAQGRDKTPIEPVIVQQLAARAGGNPFYIEELLNYMRDRGLDPRDPRALEALDLPDSLSSLILSRIDRLSESQRSTLKVASIIGRQFLFRWLWGVYPELGNPPFVRSDLDDMSRLDLTPLDQPDPILSYIFRHVLTHQVTYESQPFASRAELHGHLGYFLEREFSQELDRNIDLLAHHFDRSHEMQKRRAYLLKAGEQAQAEYANDAAISYYQRLLPLLPPQEKIPIMLKLGQVYETVGKWKEEDALYREGFLLAEELQDAHARAQLDFALGVLERKRGEFGEARRHLTGAERGFHAFHDRAGIGQVLHELGTLSAQQGEFENARAYYQESIAIRRELGENKMLGNLLSNLGILARMKNEYDNAEALYGEALSLRREIGDRWGIAVSLNNLGVLKRYQGNYQQAEEILTESLAMWREIGDRAFLANTLTSLGEVLIDKKNAPGARSVLLESLTINRALGDKRSVAFLLENFARIAYLENRTPLTIELISAARALRQSIGANLPSAEQQSLDELLESARNGMPPEQSQTLWDSGAAMTMEQAIAFTFSVMN